MRRPFYKCESSDALRVLEENKVIIQKVLEAMGEIEADLIEIPMVDDSSVKNENEEESAITFIRWVCDAAEKYGIIVGLETDFPPEKFSRFLIKLEKIILLLIMIVVIVQGLVIITGKNLLALEIMYTMFT